jgi:hypothetical protein
MDHKVYDERSKVTSENGTVHVDGPDGVDVHLTPAAAMDISDQLFEGGVTAHGQQVEKDREQASRREREAPPSEGA